MYYRDTVTNKVFIKSHLTPVDVTRLKEGGIVDISEEEYDRCSSKDPIGESLCKVFATVTRRDYTNFRDRCKAEGISMDNGLSLLVSQYGSGAVLTHVSKKALKSFSYIDEKKKGDKV